MRLRIVDCGLRIDKGRSSRGWTPTSLIRNPQSAIRNWFCCFLAACTPVTTRPDFLPDPRAARLVLDAPPARVTPEIAALVTAESLQVERMNVPDGYVETAWSDTQSRRSEEHTSELQSQSKPVSRLLLDKKTSGPARTAYAPMMTSAA